MAQDKGAEIIKFSGAAEPPQAPAPGAVAEGQGGDAPSLEELGAGAYLRAARGRASLTADAVSNATKIKAEHLEAIEWMRLDRLPALPYATGFVKTYARFLGLDAEAVAAKFKADAVAMAPAAASAPAKEREEPAGDGARLGSIFAMFAVILFMLWVGYQVIAGGERQAEATRVETTSEPQPRPRREEPQDDAVPAELTTPESMAAEAAPELTRETNSSLSEETVSAAQANVPATDEGAAPVETASPAVTDEVETPARAPAVTEARERPLPRRARPEPPQRQTVIIEAVLSRPIAPDYPNRCTRGADDRESVTLMFDVSAAGRAVNARIITSTNDCFNDEALRTVGRWRFTPRTVDGAAAVEGGKTATVNFIK